MRWLFGRSMRVLWTVVVGAALVTVFGRPDLVPVYRDFFWSDYIGLTTLVNTAMFSVAISMHELMHLMAARSLRRGVAVVKRARPPADPSAELSARERRAVRIYAVLLVPSATLALGIFALYTLPIIVSSLIQALVAVWGGLNGGSVLLGVDGGLFLLVEGGIQRDLAWNPGRSRPGGNDSAGGPPRPERCGDR